MNDPTQLKAQIKKMMVENLMLQYGPEEIGDDQPLFGPNSLGLDSVDALQLVVGLDKTFGHGFQSFHSVGFQIFGQHTSRNVNGHDNIDTFGGFSLTADIDCSWSCHCND